MKRQMRIISMQFTANQFVAGDKDVTRRVGWLHAYAGMRLRVVRKAMGLKKGERMETLGFIELTDVRREPLGLMLDNWSYGTDEVRREGFPNWSPARFVRYFCESHAVTPHAIVSRLQFKKIEVDYAEKEQDDVEITGHDSDVIFLPDRSDSGCGDGDDAA